MVRTVLAAGLALAAVLSASAQDLAPQISGELTSTSTWSHSDASDVFSGVVVGWMGLSAGTKDVKTEVKATVNTLATPAVVLDRAMVKFRFPGLRFTTGWGKVAWGPGFALPPADLLFAPQAPPVWLADAWLSLGEEAFAEAAALTDTVGARVSAAPWGVTLEAAGDWNRTENTWHAALSTQFHLGFDWYAAVRQDADTTSLGAGALGTWSPVEGWTLATRNEILTPWEHFDTAWKSYDEVSVAWDEGLSFSVRAQGAPEAWTPSTALTWNPLQNLSLVLSATWATPRLVSAACTVGW